MNPELAVPVGFASLQQGRLPEAERIFREVLASGVPSAAAVRGLALVAFMSNRHDEALALARRLIQAGAATAIEHNLVGRVLKARGDARGAEEAYRDALLLAPEASEIHISLGIAMRAQGKLAEAIDSYLRAIELSEESPEAFTNLRNAMLACDDAQRIATLRRMQAFIAARPRAVEGRLLAASLLSVEGDDAGAQLLLREALTQLGGGQDDTRMAELLKARGAAAAALICYRRAVAEQPGNAEAHYNLGVALSELGSRVHAIDAFRAAIDLKDDFADAYFRVSTLVREMDIDLAIRCQRRAVALWPDDAHAHAWLASLLSDKGEMSAAEQEARRAVELGPTHAPAYHILGGILSSMARLDDGLALLDAGVAAAPEDADIAQTRLFILNYDDRTDGAALAQASREYGERFARPRRREAFFTNARDPDRRLRIAYLSPDFRAHSVAHFIEPVFQHHDRTRFEVVAYYNYRGGDPVTDRLRSLADRWVPCAHYDDEHLYRRLREEEIDVLVDLAGHTASNRVSLLAMKPAPVVMTYLGHPTTTGVPAVDYRLSDWHVDPEGYERYNVERVLRLPHTYFCFKPDGAPEVRPPPAMLNGFVTFGSFNNLSKVSPTTIRLWAAVLRAVPDSRLYVKSKSLGDAAVREAVLARFAAEGVARDRIDTNRWQRDKTSHLELYHGVDIGLDTFPYNGATTTCEALWMGVPVVSLSGSTHASRMGRSILSAVGLGDWVVDTEGAFIDRALHAATAIDALRDLRLAMRERMAASPLLDAEAFTRDLEALYRRAWAEHCRA